MDLTNENKISVPKNLSIRQEPWQLSPCSSCPETPCCRNLPLTGLWLERQSDFITLLTASCHEGFFPAMKKSGEWIIYLSRDCRHLEKECGKCLIHQSQSQSLICKSYDAHRCWYVDAFSRAGYSTLIPFDTEMLIWLEKKYSLMEKGFAFTPEWDELCESVAACRNCNPGQAAIENLSTDALLFSNTLSFRKSREERYLFLPPYKRAEHLSHFELISFRLGFPGVRLAMADNVWAFVIDTSLNIRKIDLIRNAYYPAIRHRDCLYSFDNLEKESRPFSETGGQWVIINRRSLDLLKASTVFDSSGRVKKIPSTSQILDMLKFSNPDMAA
ncbi:MAG: hypothetical protein H7A26_07005 [Spirochaetales bacterium]|nr:hypothetical protein [Spirochaetales bacterium]